MTQACVSQGRNGVFPVMVNQLSSHTCIKMHVIMDTVVLKEYILKDFPLDKI